jgi:hypothetical protein
MEKYADQMESPLISHIKDISVTVARIEQKLKMECRHL